LKILFKFFFLDRAGPGPLILDWAGLVRTSEQWSSLHCSHATWTVESEFIHYQLFTQNSGERPEKKQEKETDRAALDGGGGRRWFFFFSHLLRCFFFLCFCFFSVSSSVSHGAGPLSMTGRTVATVCGGAASNDEEREARERDYCSSLLLCYLFFPSPVFCSFFFICWWQWQRLGLRTVAGKPGGSCCDGGSAAVLSVVAGRKGRGAGGGATVALLLPLLSCSFTLLSPFSSFFLLFCPSSSTLKQTPPPCFLFSPFPFSKLSGPSCFCFFPFVSASLSFSKILPPGSFLSFSKKSSPLPFGFVLSPVFIGSRGRGSPYPVQVQGMVAWDLQGMVV